MKIVGGKLNKKDFTEKLAKSLSRKAGQPYSPKFLKLAEKKVDLGAFEVYQKETKEHTEKVSKKEITKTSKKEDNKK